MTGLDLYRRGIRTAVACWEAYARAIDGATVDRATGVDIAVFAKGPERRFFNNAVLGHGLRGGRRRDAVDAMTQVYGGAGIVEYAAWVHESDAAMVAELTRRGFAHQETTWAMGRTLTPAPVTTPPENGIDITLGEWEEYLGVLELPDGMLAAADPRDFQVAVGRLGSQVASAGMAFDHEGDVGIFNVATAASARRRGIGSAVVARLLREAAARGARTATLQSTAMARSVYAGLGFLDLGRILEFGPPEA